MKTSLRFLLYVSISWVVPSHGSELNEYGQSIRALGMGHAFSAVVRDYEALYYNPAALSRIEGLNFNFMNLSFGASGENAISLSESMTQSSGNGLDQFSGLFGQQVWFGGRGKANFTTTNFGVGTFGWGNLSLELKNPIIPYFNVNYVSDYGFLVGGAFEVAPQTHLGLTLKRITRSSISTEIGVSQFLSGDTSGLQSDFLVDGVAYGADIGVLWEPGGLLNPVFSGVWKDFGTTRFLKLNTTTKPDAIPEEKILGMAFGFDLFALGMTAAFDYKHADKNDEQLGKKIHMGLEVDLPILDVRGGFSQGYYSIGTSMDFLFMRMDMAYYAVELGEYPGQDPDRRFELAMTMDLNLDVNFKLIDLKNAKNSKLKKRR